MSLLLLNRKRYVGPADSLAARGMTTAAFGSLFLVRAAWANQAVVRGRRSTDQAERDFLAVATFNGYRVVDGADLVAWSQGGDVLATRLNDQMGSGLPWAQDAAALQPYLVTAGVLETMSGAPAIRFDPVAGQRLVSAITPPLVRTAVVTAVVQVSGASRGMLGSASSVDGRTIIRVGASAAVEFGPGSPTLSTALNINVPGVWAASIDAGGAVRGRAYGTDYGPQAVVQGAPPSGLVFGSASNTLANTMDGRGGECCLIAGAPPLATVGAIIGNLRRLVG